MDSAAWISIAGIATSGVVGPTATQLAARRAARKQFVRDRAAGRRDELRSLIDSATVAASLGAVRLREMAEAAKGSPEEAKTRAWAEEVFSAAQRLTLRLGPADPVVTSYVAMRDGLVALGELGTQQHGDAYEAAFAEFERLRDVFLIDARKSITAPVSDAEDSW